MTITSGLVDSHHETELTPSNRLVPTSWLARHMGMLLLIAAAATAACLLL